MQQSVTSPIPMHAGRQALASRKHHSATVGDAPKDARWSLLDLARTCRRHLNLRDRDIMVLRGLLSLLRPDPNHDQMMVYASNRVLIERCDGIDERTLRRRLVHLQSCGLLMRRSSPNGKRYQVKDHDAQSVLAYGIDLSPIFHIRSHLEALAEECRREDALIRVLRSQIRDILFRNPTTGSEHLRETARLSLRRSIDSTELREIFAQLETAAIEHLANSNSSLPSNTNEMSGSDSQTDRHIQSQIKENYESVSQDNRQQSQPTTLVEKSAYDDDITVRECITLARTATELCGFHPESWDELAAVAAQLAPSVGIEPRVLQYSQMQLGRYGFTLAILGIIEAIGHIRNPSGYLNSLAQRFQRNDLNLITMFRSLAGRVTGPQHHYGTTRCIPR
ncbi:plasmid replication protein RepC [Paracoccus litorisediminis]|uniref:Replication initiation protein RepC n=1 Tax=Paracoccus litorisediminis TaxID=2006130 RepID=A0A844HSP0_9RHOB|nr:plasmid replication protein RepC [Paracoccus litorisediminis]MTH62179.1 hypothetical protein [Paracoccus litorisediminis]